MKRSSEKLLAELLTGIVTVEKNIPILSITNDSRKVQNGSLFIAYPGLQADGRDYIKQAIAQGASAICYEPYTTASTNHSSGNSQDLRSQGVATRDNNMKRQVNRWEPVPRECGGSLKTKALGRKIPRIAGMSGNSIDLNSPIPLIPVTNLAEKQAIIASRFFNQPSAEMQVIGITGTNGKTSCSHFVAQGMQQIKQKAAVIGTLGYGSPDNLNTSQHTTPDAITLQKIFAELRDQEFKTVAMEVSSHALAQHRVDHIQFDIAIFTQLSRDHLDYHGDMQAYARAKELLFRHPGLRYAAINLDDELGLHLIKTYSSSLEIIPYSASGKFHPKLPSVVATKIKHQSHGFDVLVQTPWGQGEFHSHLLGTFNASNLLAVIAVFGILKIPFAEILSIVSSLKTVPGRMELFGGEDSLPMVVVDYSHTPDALEKALAALRDHCRGDVWCVFGCGGDRDKGKRPQMAAIAEKWCDHVIVTSDNPRNEDPWQIIADIQKGFSKLKQVQVEPDRAAAIAQAIQFAKRNDVVLIAGKGHENYQIIGNQILPFSDSKQVQNQLHLLKSQKGTER